MALDSTYREDPVTNHGISPGDQYRADAQVEYKILPLYMPEEGLPKLLVLSIESNYVHDGRDRVSGLVFANSGGNTLKQDAILEVSTLHWQIGMGAQVPVMQDLAGVGRMKQRSGFFVFRILPCRTHVAPRQMMTCTRFVLIAVLFIRHAAVCAEVPSAGLKITRAVAALNGVFSPRGFFNITVRLYQLDGVDAAKYDLKKSQITLDFKPGITVTPERIQDVMAGAGYKPGPVHIQLLAPNEVFETGPGWVKIKHPQSKNRVVRWFQLNF